MITLLFSLIITAGPQFPIPKDVEETAEAGLEYLVDHQHADGLVYENNRSQFKIANSSLTGLAILSQGSNPREGKYSSQINKIVKSLLSQSIKTNGLLASREIGGSQIYEHSFSLLFLSEVYGQHRPEDSHIKRTISKAIDMLVGSQSKLGGWRYDIPCTDSDLSVTVAVIMALRSCKSAGFKIPDSTIDKAKDYVLKCQKKDGSFSYQYNIENDFFQTGGVRTAAALTAIFNIGIFEGKNIERSIKHLEGFHPSRTEISCSGKTNEYITYYPYGNYYAAAAAKQIGNKFWEDWYNALSRQIIKHKIQKAEGTYWRFSEDSITDTAFLCIVLYMPNDFLPIFQD